MPSTAKAKEVGKPSEALESPNHFAHTFIPDDQQAKLAIIRKTAAQHHLILNEGQRGTARSDEKYRRSEGLGGKSAQDRRR